MPVSTWHSRKCTKCGKRIYVQEGDVIGRDWMPTVCEDCRKTLKAKDIWANLLSKRFPFD